MPRCSHSARAALRHDGARRAAFIDAGRAAFTQARCPAPISGAVRARASTHAADRIAGTDAGGEPRTAGGGVLTSGAGLPALARAARQSDFRIAAARFAAGRYGVSDAHLTRGAASKARRARAGPTFERDLATITEKSEDRELPHAAAESPPFH